MKIMTFNWSQKCFFFLFFPMPFARIIFSTTYCHIYLQRKYLFHLLGNNLKWYPALNTSGLLGRRVVFQDPGVHQTLQGMHFSISTFLWICSIIFFCVKPPCPAGSSDWDLSSAAGWSGRARPRTRARGTWWTWTIKYSDKDWRWGILFPGKMCWRKRTWGRPW